MSKKDPIDDIADYYRQSSEDNRYQVQQLEFYMTARLLQKYLPKQGRVLELGAGSGRFTLEMLRGGLQVTSIEMVDELKQISQKRIEQFNLADQATLLTGDARDVGDLVEGSFDAILVMGPFYHLVEKLDRNDLMKSLHKILSKDGVLISVHLSKIGLMSYMMSRFPQWVVTSPDEFDQILSEGQLPNHPRNGEFRGFFTDVEEITKLHSSNGFKLKRVHSQDPCIGAVDEVFNPLPDDLKIAWANRLTEISDHSLALGSGRSLFCVGAKV